MKKYYLQAVLFTLSCLVLARCASTTTMYVQPKSIAGSQYAEIEVEQSKFTSASVIRLTEDFSLPPSQWDTMDAGDSSGKATAKFLYSMTPWGIATNLAHGKSFMGTTTMYRVPAGRVKLLVYNRHNRKIPFSEYSTIKGIEEGTHIQSAMESSCWGTVLSTVLESGQRYRLTSETFKSSSARSGEVEAYVKLVGESGKDAVSGYEFLTSMDELEMSDVVYLGEGETAYTAVKDLQDFSDDVNYGTNKALMKGLHKDSQVMSREINIAIQQMNQFSVDIANGKYDSKTSPAQ